MLAALLGAGAWFQPSVAGSDLWWHLAAGREIWEQHAVPTTDHFSFTFAGQPWMHHEWLWGAGYWLLYRLAPDAVAWANLALLFAVFGVGFWVARRHTGSTIAAGAALWAAAATSFWFLDIRPHEVTLLFVGLVLLTRDRTWARWAWAPLMVLWCNLHGGFVFGLGAIGLFAVVETAEASLAARRPAIDWTLWLGVALALLAFLANPWGVRILEYPIAYLDSNSPFREILEWQKPPFTLDPRDFAGRFFLLLGAVASGAALEVRGRWRDGRAGGDLYLVALAGVTSAMALTSRRFIPLFAITSLPLSARLAAELAAPLARRLPARALQAVPALALVAALLLWRDVDLYPRPLARWTEYHLYPRAAVKYMQAVQPGPRVLNYYNWGGYLMLHAPEFKLLIDGRANTLYDVRVYNDYLALLGAADGLPARLALYAPDVALVPPGSLARMLASPQYGWVLLYVDEVAAVLVPPSSPVLRRALPRADDVLRGDPQYQLAKAAQLNDQNKPADARPLIERAIALDPLIARAYGDLAETAARERDLPGIAAATARGLAADSRFAQGLYQLESHAYELAGEPRLALESLERAMPRGPFSRPENVRQDVERLRRTVASR